MNFSSAANEHSAIAPGKVRPRFHFPGQRMIRPDGTWVSKIDAAGENASTKAAETAVSTVRDSSIGSMRRFPVNG
jgi:hypothetical protein